MRNRLRPILYCIAVILSVARATWLLSRIHQWYASPSTSAYSRRHFNYKYLSLVFMDVKTMSAGTVCIGKVPVSVQISKRRTKSFSRLEMGMSVAIEAHHVTKAWLNGHLIEFNMCGFTTSADHRSVIQYNDGTEVDLRTFPELLGMKATAYRYLEDNT